MLIMLKVGVMFQLHLLPPASAVEVIESAPSVCLSVSLGNCGIILKGLCVQKDYKCGRCVNAGAFSFSVEMKITQIPY